MKRKKQGFTLLEMTSVTGIKNTESEHVILLYISVFFNHFNISLDSQNRKRKQVFNTFNVYGGIDLLGLNTLDPIYTDYQKRLIYQWINQA